MTDGPGEAVPTGMADSDGKADGEADEAGAADGEEVGGSYVHAGLLSWAQAAKVAAMVTTVTICNVRICAGNRLIAAF